VLSLVGLSLLGAACLGSLMLYRKQVQELPSRTPTTPKALPPAQAQERTLQTLRPGDVVGVGNEDWLISHSARLREEEDVWFWHALDGGDGQQRFLEVRRRGGWVAAFFAEVDDLPTFGSLGNGLTFRGQPYQLEARGDARETDLDGTSAKILRYVTYSGPGDSLLNVEEREGTRQGYLGNRVLERNLTLMPGSAPEQDGLSDMDALVKQAEDGILR